MAGFCSKCGKTLGNDGFCLKCIEFTEKKEIKQETSEIDTAVLKEPPYADSEVKAYIQIPNEELQIKQKSRVNLIQIVLVVIMTVVICVTGVFVISRVTAGLDKKSANDAMDSNRVELLGEAHAESINSANFGDFLDEEETYDDSVETYVYEADYEEIMQAGEASNAYTLFAATKEDVVPIINEYFVEQGLDMSYESDMDNTYEMVGDEKITYYETFSMWSEGEDDQELYLISSDTVTGKLLYIVVYKEDNEEAIKLIRRSLETIDPNLTEEQLQETCHNIANSTDYVDEFCGDYEVQGSYLEEQNLYYYYISSLLGN